MLPIWCEETPAGLIPKKGTPVFLTGTIIPFKMIATDGRTKKWSDLVLAYQNKVQPDWEPDENPAHHVYARSAAMPAEYCCAQTIEGQDELCPLFVSSVRLPDAGQLDMLRSESRSWSFHTSELSAPHR